MTKFNDGGLAFPSREEMSPGQIRLHFGMTYRQWLAGMALQGILSNRSIIDVLPKEGITYDMEKHAIRYADAVIAEEERTRNDKTT